MGICILKTQLLLLVHVAVAFVVVFLLDTTTLIFTLLFICSDDRGIEMIMTMIVMMIVTAAVSAAASASASASASATVTVTVTVSIFLILVLC